MRIAAIGICTLTAYHVPHVLKSQKVQSSAFVCNKRPCSV